jgi:hypothetical protein
MAGVSMSDKLSIANEMAQFDRKNRGFYDSLTPEEKKKFSNFLMIRYGSSVQGSRELQEFYLISTNERLNKNFFAINREPKLQWLAATTVSPGMGSQRHQWIAPAKKEPGNNKAEKFLAEIYPTAKTDEIKLLMQINTKDDLKELARKHGWDEKRIKTDL